MRGRLLLAAACFVSCGGTPAGGQRDETSTAVPADAARSNTLPSLRRLGGESGREEVISFRFGEVTRSVEIDGFGRVVLRDPSIGADFEVVLATSAGKPANTYLSENGRWLVVHHHNQAVELWDATSGVRAAELGYASSTRASLAETRPIGVVSMDHTAKVVSLDSGEVHEVELEQHSLFVAPDGMHAVIGTVLWDLSDEPRRIAEVQGLMWLLGSHGFSNDSSLFAYSTYDGEFRVVRSTDGHEVLTIGGPEAKVRGDALTWTPDDTHLLISESGGTYAIDLATGSMTSHAGRVAAISPKGDSMIIARFRDVIWAQLGEAEPLASVSPGSEYTAAAFVDDKPVIGDPNGTAKVEGKRSSDVSLSASLKRGTRLDPRGFLVTDEGDGGTFGRLHPQLRSAKTDESALRAVTDAYALDFVDEETLVTYGAGLTRWSVGEGLRSVLVCPLSSMAAGQNSETSEVAAFAGGVATRNASGIWLHKLDKQCTKPERRTDDVRSETSEFHALASDATSPLVLDDKTALNLTTQAATEHGGVAVRDAAINPAGDALAIRMSDRVRIVRENGDAREVETGPTHAVAWGSDGERLFVAGERGLSIITGSTIQATVQFAGASLESDDVEVSNLTVSGDTVAWNAETSAGEQLVIASLDKGSVLASLPGSFPFAVHPDQAIVAFAVPGWIRTFAAASAHEVSSTRTQLRSVERLAFSPGGTRLAAIGHGVEVFEHEAR